MPLPDIIEVLPLDRPVQARITVPGSKSITNRALILAALAEGETTLRGALWSEDTQVMVEALQTLGFMVNVEPDLAETCNRTITVYGKGGVVPPGGSETQPVELFVGNAGTAARFLAAFVCLGKGFYRLEGVSRMHQRPQSALFQALRELGYRVDSVEDRLPALILGSGPRSASCRVSLEESSQFGSALLLCSKVAGWQVQVVGENAEESAYVKMTLELVESFSKSSGVVQVEPDASSGSYFWAINALPIPGAVPRSRDQLPVVVPNWPDSGMQPDAAFPQYMPVPGLPGPAVLSRNTHLGDSIMTAVVISPFSTEKMLFTDLGRLRLQECERVQALRTELTKCGAQVVERGDTLEVFPSSLHGAEIETYNDHRMAMCFTILGLKVAGIRIKNPACVKKTFPDFFQKLAAPLPHGLGAKVRDPGTGAVLEPAELVPS